MDREMPRFEMDGEMQRFKMDGEMVRWGCTMGRSCSLFLGAGRAAEEPERAWEEQKP